MELRQLKYFIASAEALNFTVAANECCITQSTLSQQIKQLENDLGTPLFERIGKRVFLRLWQMPSMVCSASRTLRD